MKKLITITLTSILVSFALLFPLTASPALADTESNCDSINFQDGVENTAFDCFNPLASNDIDTLQETSDLSTPRGILSRVLAFSFPLAGLILFVMITWGGFQIVVNSGSKKSIDTGRERVTAAIVGFIILFSSYWIIQIVETIFDLRIL